MHRSLRPITASMFLLSFSLVLFELLLTRLFGVVLFAPMAHLALALALLGIGVGAVIQHVRPQTLPAEGFEGALARVCMAQAITMLIAVACVTRFPLMMNETIVDANGIERLGSDRVNVLWFSLLLPILMVPFVFAGLGFSGAFQRRKEHIGRLYGADLIGGGIAAVAFIPLLGWLAGPDLVWPIALAPLAAATALWSSTGNTTARRVGLVASAAAVIASMISLTGVELMRLNYFAGHDPANVTYTQWTALTRLSIYERDTRRVMLLDAGSSSTIITQPREVKRFQKFVQRNLIYDLHEPPGRVAVLAASAGPEVALAQAAGFREVEAIDIAGEIGDIVAQRYPDSTVNPYAVHGTKRVKADARAAIMHADGDYDIIQMVHANLHSNAGLMANAWSPALLETKEAFETYLDHLSEDGTIVFARGPFTPAIARSAAEALLARGQKRPWAHIAHVTHGARQQLLLVKGRPWTSGERKKLKKAVAKYKAKLAWDPGARPNGRILRMLFLRPLMTDDRPYIEEPGRFWNAFDGFFTNDKDAKRGAIDSLYHSLAIQWIFAVVLGAVFLFAPLLRWGPKGVAEITRVPVALGYVACLGYGYLAVETVLIHELVLFVGHPTYAVTVVILTLLLSSGAGSIFVGRLAPHRVPDTLRRALLAILVLGAIQAWVVPDWMRAHALGMPLGARLALTGACLFPLGFVMGMPFPAGMRLLPDSAASVVPWAWALNGWMSVVASLLTVNLSRAYGYSHAFAAALGAYAIALMFAPQLRGVGRRVHYSTPHDADDKTPEG